MASWSFNPFTGNLDLTGSSGAVVFEGEVATFADLPVTIGDPAVGAAYLVRDSTGVWLVNRRQAGIYIRRNNTGVAATDWEYGGDYPVTSVNNQSGNVVLAAADVGAAASTHAASHLPSGSDQIFDQPLNTTDEPVFLSLKIEDYSYPGQYFKFVILDAHQGAQQEQLALYNADDGAVFNFGYGSGLISVPFTFTNTITTKKITANNGTLTASAPVLDLAQTWNAGGVTFTGLRFNVTNTASATASLIADWQVGGSSMFYVRRDGRTIGAGGVYGANGLEAGLLSQGVVAGSASYIGLCSATTATDATCDTRLFRDAADTLAQRRSTTAQTFNIYNTFTSATNHERGFLKWSSNVFQIGTEKGSGGGTARNLEFLTDGTTRVTLDQTALRTGTTKIVLGSGANIEWGSGAIGIQSSTSASPAYFKIFTASTDRLIIDPNGLLCIGGTTSSFPALKRSSTVLQARLANDSDFAPLQGQLRTHANAVTETITADKTLTLYDAAGTAYKVPCVAA